MRSGRARAQIPLAVCFATVRSERVAEDIEALLTAFFSKVFTSLSVSPSLIIAALVHAMGAPRTRD